jgi:hypothetical protein
MTLNHALKRQMENGSMMQTHVVFGGSLAPFGNRGFSLPSGV